MVLIGHIGRRLIIPALCVVMSGCGHHRYECGTPSHNDVVAGLSESVNADVTDSILTVVDSIIDKLPRERKAAQMVMPAIYSSSDYFTLKKIKEYARNGVGGIILLKGDSRSVRTICDTFRYYSDLPVFVAIDAEWGLGMRLEDARKFPMNSELASGITEEELFDYGEEIARECRELGINMVLGPVADVASKGIMSRRSFGSDPRRVADLSVAYSRGLESGGVISVAKHFPGHGAVTGDSHTGRQTIERSLHNLDSVSLYPFRRYIEQQLSAIMVGHLAVPSIDPIDRPAAVSPVVINDLLREDLGFSGLVLTDAMNMGGAAGFGPAKAVEAGADIVLVPLDTRKAIEEIASDSFTLDSSLRRILFYKYLLK